MQSKWKDFSILPKNGEEVLVCTMFKGIEHLIYSREGFFWNKWDNSRVYFSDANFIGWMSMPNTPTEKKELNMEAKWYGKDVKPELGQKVISFYKEFPDNDPMSIIEVYAPHSNGAGEVFSFLDIPGFVAWTPLPKSKEEMEKEQLKQMIESTRDQLDNFLHTAFLSTGDLSRSFLNEVADLLKRLS